MIIFCSIVCCVLVDLKDINNFFILFKIRLIDDNFLFAERRVRAARGQAAQPEARTNTGNNSQLPAVKRHN